jgi:uncharacterized coiled-coil DUF342 family protein
MAEWTHWHSKGADALLAACEKAEKERDDLKAQVEALGNRLCEHHDTNPLNETVERLEKERDEARQAARDYRRGVTRFLSTGFRLPEYVGVDDGELVAKHPWLKERP